MKLFTFVLYCYAGCNEAALGGGQTFVVVIKGMHGH